MISTFPPAAVLRREDKYKAKSFMDTFVYRAGDQIGAWFYPLLTRIGLGLTGCPESESERNVDHPNGIDRLGPTVQALRNNQQKEHP
jgi:hypothetical protein